MLIKYKILQKPISNSHNDKFRRGDYLATYKGEIITNQINETEMCEYLFEKFNISHPENFASHSMKIGDAIEFNYVEQCTRTIYLCKSIGFEEIYRSNPDEPF